MRGIWETSGRHLGSIREASERHLGGFWEASGTPGGHGAAGGSESRKSMPLSAKMQKLPLWISQGNLHFLTGAVWGLPFSSFSLLGSSRCQICIPCQLPQIWEHLEASGRHLEASEKHLRSIWEASGTPGGHGAAGGSESRKSMPLSTKMQKLPLWINQGNLLPWLIYATCATLFEASLICPLAHICDVRHVI